MTDAPRTAEPGQPESGPGLTTSAGTADGADATRWRLGEAFLLRVAGQPADVVAGLRTERAAAWTARTPRPRAVAAR